MSDSSRQVDGACHCGAIKYTATIDPGAARICHCSDCQTLSGTAFRVVVGTKEADFNLTSGALKIYVKTAESGNQREQSFCGNCGTPIYATSVGGEDRMLGLRVGALQQRDQLTPVAQIWARSAQNWLDTVSGLPSSDGG